MEHSGGSLNASFGLRILSNLDHTYCSESSFHYYCALLFFKMAIPGGNIASLLSSDSVLFLHQILSLLEIKLCISMLSYLLYSLTSVLCLQLHFPLWESWSPTISLYAFISSTLHQTHKIPTTDNRPTKCISNFFAVLFVLRIYAAEIQSGPYNQSCINSFPLWLYQLLDIEFHSFVDISNQFKVSFSFFLLTTVFEYGKHI